MHSSQYLELDTVIIMLFDCGPFKLNWNYLYREHNSHREWDQMKQDHPRNWRDGLQGIVCAWVLTSPKPWKTKKQN